MGEGVSDPNYSLAAWFQQAVGDEHVSDIGVYYDVYREMAEKHFGWLRETTEEK